MENGLPNGAISNCQSGCSTRPPSQRFPKVSIGVMVDKTPKMGYAARKDDETLHLVKKIAASSQEKIVEENRGLGTTTIFGEKDALAKENVSPWVSTRSIYSETPNAQTICFHAKASVLQSGDGLHEKLDGVTCGMRKEKSGNFGRIKEVAFVATQETHPIHKGSAEGPVKVREGRSEALRMKLWEALGAASSQYKHISSPPLVNGNAKISNSETYMDEQTHEIPKPRHETDTIETDSENPDMTLRKVSPHQSMRRPFTRSLARKKDPGKTLPKLQFQKNNAKKYLSSSKTEKQKPEKKNMYSFDEGEKQKKSSMFAANGHTPLSAQKKQETKSARVEPRRISFPSRSASLQSIQSDKNVQSNAKEQTLPPLKDEANKINTMQGTQTFHCEMKEKTQPPSNSDSGKTVHSKSSHLEDLSNSLLNNRSEPRELDDSHLQRQFQGSQSRLFSRDEHSHVKVSCPKLAKGRASLDHLYSPTFAANIAPSPETKSIENRCHSPMLSGEKVQPRNLRSPLNPTTCSSESAAYPETSDGTRDSQVSPTGESYPIVKGKTEEKCSSPSQVQPSSSESLATDEIIGKDLRKTGTRNSNASDHSESPITLHHGKRARSLEDIEVRLDPSSASPFNSGTEEATDSHCFTDQCPQDSLARAIIQLAVVLERFKAKIKLRTCKKSSEILSSVGDSIHLQLQEIESLIQADIEKFTSLGRSKRKRLESTFLGQQEKLKAIHDKFKKEVNQHLLDCRSTLEDLETYQKELKGSVERQKAAHRKLILQVEGAMKSQLADAETNIAAVHKAARKKMEGMKHVLREWLADDGTFH